MDMKPIFRYDGACPLCRAWVKRWKRTSGDAVAYEPFSEGESRASSEFVGADGTVSRGAEGVFRLLATGTDGRWLRWYRQCPPFALACELAYRLVSTCRVCAYEFTKRWVHE